LASWYPTSEKPSHGIFIQNHAKALSKFCKVSIAYAYASDTPDVEVGVYPLNEACVEYRIAYKKNASFLKPFFHYFAAKKAYTTLFKHLKNNGSAVTAIQVNVIFPIAIILPLALRIFKVPYTIVEHWSGYLTEDGNYKGFLKTWFTKKTVRGAQTIFHVSEPMRQAMQQHGLQGKYELLYNVVDTTLFKPDKKQEIPLLVHVSSLEEREKNMTGLLQIVSELQKRALVFETLIIGGSIENLTQVQNKIKSLHLKDITCCGYLPQEQIAEHLKKSWAFILPSYFEGMPVVVLEALACGVPVFASPVGHLPHLIHSGNGFLSKDLDALTLALAHTLSGKQQWDTSQISASVNELVSFDAVGKKLVTHYKSI
jgi:L-malate glycosyltransferase